MIQFTKLPGRFNSVTAPLLFTLTSDVYMKELVIEIRNTKTSECLGMKIFRRVLSATFDITPFLRTQSNYRIEPGPTGFVDAASRLTECVVIAYKTDKWNISRLDNSFQLSGVMLLDSAVDNEMEAEKITRLAEQKFAGNPGQVMFLIRDAGDENDNSRFIPIHSQNEGDWKALHEQAVGDIVVAHSWLRTLSGLDYGGGFSAERILHEYEVALNTVILGEQAELMEPVRRVIGDILRLDASSLQIVNRPPTRSKPLYMKVWEARKADGLDYDPDDERQQMFLSEIAKYNLKSME